jgi:hypothetical protein
VLLCQQPFVGDDCEGVGLSVAFRAPFDARVDAVRYVPPSVVAFLARSFQGDVGVRAEGEEFFYLSAEVCGAVSSGPGRIRPSPVSVEK